MTPNGNNRHGRIGLNTDLVAGILAAALLGWVGVTTYRNALETRELSSRLGFFVAEHRAAELRRIADLGRIETDLDGVWPRLRAVERATQRIPAPAGATDIQRTR